MFDEASERTNELLAHCKLLRVEQDALARVIERRS
jgi:hypothetical protein